MLGTLVLLALTICVYTPAMKGEFFLDDRPKIVENPDIRDLQHIWSKVVYP